MDIFKIARYFALGLLLIPLGLVLLWLVITFLPGLAELLSKIAWGVLGQIPIFSLASQLLEGFLSFESFSMGNYFLCFMALLFGALGDSLIVACCVFAVKAFSTTFNRKSQGKFTRPIWQITLIGVVIGSVICLIKNLLPGLWAAILTLVVALGCYIAGFVILFRSLSLPKSQTYRNRRAGFIIDLLLGIVGDLFDAFCGVFILTAMLQGPIYVKEGGSLLLCLLWIVLSVILLFVKNALLDLLKPEDV